jgi:hypothetical protein
VVGQAVHGVNLCSVAARLSWHLAAVIFLIALALPSTPAWAEIQASFLMEHDPEIIAVPPVVRFSPRLKAVWLEALNRPEAEMQRQAAGAIARAHPLGMEGLAQAESRLLQILAEPGTHPSARQAAAAALIELNARTAAQTLAESARRYGADLRQIVEPALAGWDYPPLRDVWQARLKAPDVHRRDLLLAVRCLESVGDKSASDALLQIVHDPVRSSETRAAAARAAGAVQVQGLEPDVRRLVNGGTVAPLLNRLCAVQLVRRHSGEAAQSLLESFAVDAEPAVAVIALERLLEIDPQLVVPLAEGAMTSLDPKVRRCGAEAYVRVPNQNRVSALSQLLDDPHPAVRGYVRDSMFALAKIQELDESVRGSAMQVLSGNTWRGLEQAALLLGALDHEPAAARMLELVDFARPEVAISAAWGLKVLAIPETLPAQLKIAEQRTELRMTSSEPIPSLDQLTAHLLESFGMLNYEPAEPLLRRYVPKVFPMGVYSRAAAIWSLGLLHKGVPDDSLAAALLGRVTDTGRPSELPAVQAMSAISIGRMKAVSQLEPLRQHIGPQLWPDRMGMTFRWTLMELTGEPIPIPEPAVISRSGWFLEPIEGPN